MSPILTAEFNWVIDRLREKKFTIALQMADSLLEAWRTQQSSMKVYGKMRRQSERYAALLEAASQSDLKDQNSQRR